MSDVGGVPPVKLLKKLNKIMGEISPILKEGYNTFHKYKYATEFAVVTAIREKLIEHGVMIVPTTETVTVENDLTGIMVAYHIFDIDSGEKLCCVFGGQGKDSQDKGIYKAYTGANKYFLLKTFQVPTTDDPENAEPEPKGEAPPNVNTKTGEVKNPKWPTKEQKEELKKLIKERDVPEQALKNIKAQMGYGGGAEYLTAQAFILQLKKCPYKKDEEPLPLDPEYLDRGLELGQDKIGE